MVFKLQRETHGIWCNGLIFTNTMACTINCLQAKCFKIYSMQSESHKSTGENNTIISKTTFIVLTLCSRFSLFKYQSVSNVSRHLPGKCLAEANFNHTWETLGRSIDPKVIRHYKDFKFHHIPGNIGRFVNLKLTGHENDSNFHNIPRKIYRSINL
jgi:hypothetical protein